MPLTDKQKEAFAGKYIDADFLKQELNRFYKPDGNFEPGTDPVTGEKKTRIAISISGGGAAGAFEAGIIEILKENGIVPDLICGASAGSLNAAGIFYERLEVENRQPEIGIYPERSFIARLWRFIGRNNDGAKYVVDKPRLITTLSRDLLGQKKRGIFNLFIILFSILPELFGSAAVIFLLAGFLLYLWGFVATLFPRLAPTLTITTGPAFLLGSFLVFLGLFFIFRQVLSAKSIFSNTRLYNTLFNATQSGDMSSLSSLPQEKLEKEAQNIVRKWFDKINEGAVPEFIVTTTNLTNKSGMLMTLAKKETYKRLVQDEWYAVQLLDRDGETSAYFREIAQDTDLTPYEKSRALFADGSRLFKGILSSTSIPVIFPSQELEIYDSNGKSGAKTNHFTDGGVLNNSPVQVAIAAGATHVISIELDDLRFIPFSGIPDEKVKNRTYTMMDTLTRTFFTLLTNATSEDVARSAGWNKTLVHEGAIKDRRLVQIYRIAPVPDKEIWPIGLIDFNGRFEDGKRVTTLTDWMNYGKKVASGKAFWRATLQVYPTDLPQ